MHTNDSSRPHRRSHRWAALASVGIIAATFVTAAGTANALAPANDNYADRATIVKDTPVDISFADATNEPAIDAEATIAACGFDPTSSYPNAQTVWYDFTPTLADKISVAISAPGYHPPVVVTGEPGSFVGQGCGGEAAIVDVVPGVTYHIMASDLDGASSIATILISHQAPAPTFSVTVNPTGTVDVVNDVVTFSGTYRCTSESPAFASIGGSMEQLNGRLYVASYFDGSPDPTICDGADHAWQGAGGRGGGFFATGRFQGGKVTANLYSLYVCNGLCTSIDLPPTTVQLKAVKGTPPPPPPPPAPTTPKITVDRSATLDRATGLVAMSGTFTCSGGDEAFLVGNLRQIYKNVFIDAHLDGIDLGQCDGTTQRWAGNAWLVPDFGIAQDIFASGPATLTGDAFTCTTDFVCGNDAVVSAQVKVKAVGQQPPFPAVPAGISVQFDRRVPLDTATNTATVNGTITCIGGGQVGMPIGQVVQMVGQVHVGGGTFVGGNSPCDGLPRRFSFSASGSPKGLYAGGKATAYLMVGFLDADFGFSNGIGIAQGDVRLVPVKPKK